ncbi:MAG: hypothetical protein MUF84_05535 [Anaerolineae bacterium]|nr:hypothetical protein [Anaerolineae bacterium]
MASGPRQRLATHGLSNLLIRRVMRHRNVATLFRGAPSEPPRTEAGTYIEDPSSEASVVTAVPVAFPDIVTSYEPIAFPVAAPADGLVGEPGVSPVALSLFPSRSEGRPIVQTVEREPVSQPNATPSEVSRPAPTALEAVQVPSIAEAGPTAQVPPLISSQGSPGVPTAGQGAPVAQSTAKSPEIRRSPFSTRETRPLDRFGPAPTAQVLQATSAPAERPSPALDKPSAPPPRETQFVPDNTEASSDTSLTDDVWRRLETIFRRHQDHDAILEAGMPQEPRATPRGDSRETPTVTTLPATPLLERHAEPGERSSPLDAPGFVAAPTTAVVSAREPIDSVLSPRSLSTREDVGWSAGAEDSPESSLEPLEHTEAQPVPLQSVWNVQQIPLTAQAAPQALEAVARPIPELSDAPVREALERVAPGGATQSTIELLPPRRPRPRIQVPIGVRASADAAGAAPLSLRVGEPSLVQTAIGPLPADLWELIGEPLPDEVESNRSGDGGEWEELPALRSGVVEPSPQGVPTTEVTSAQTQVMPAQTQVTPAQPQDAPRAEANPMAEASPLTRATIAGGRGRTSDPTAEVTRFRPAPTAVGPHLIQRTPAQPRVAPSASATAPVSAPPTESAQASPASELPDSDVPDSEGGSNVDVAELARRVYAEIKRRLSVERERSRSPWH